MPEVVTADFIASVTTGTAPLAVDFTDQSTGSPTGWSWDFGDGGTSTDQNSSYTYTTAGTYTVTAGSYDGHDGTQSTQPQEQWRVAANSGWLSPFTADIGDVAHRRLIELTVPFCVFEDL